MEKKIVKGITFIVGILFFGVFLYQLVSLSNEKSTDKKIKRVEETSSITLAITSDKTTKNKKIDITTKEDINKIMEIANNITIKDEAYIRVNPKLVIPQIILYDNSGKIIAKIELYDESAVVEGKVTEIKVEGVKKLKKIISKYIENNYGKITCQNGIKTDIYYLYDNEIIKYVSEIRDLPENANLEKLKEKVAESENVANYSAFLSYNSNFYGQFPVDEIVKQKEGYFYYSDTYLIEKMIEQEFNNLLNASKSDFKNKTFKDIESNYAEGSCEYSIW